MYKYVYNRPTCLDRRLCVRGFVVGIGRRAFRHHSYLLPLRYSFVERLILLSSCRLSPRPNDGEHFRESHYCILRESLEPNFGRKIGLSRAVRSEPDASRRGGEKRRQARPGNKWRGYRTSCLSSAPAPRYPLLRARWSVWLKMPTTPPTTRFLSRDRCRRQYRHACQ